MSNSRVERIQATINTALQPDFLDIIDDSQAHAGDPGAQNGAGHYVVSIVSKQFVGCSMVQRHRLVYDALASFMPTEIHALRIKALTPDEKALKA
ncbi:transcriptional regulator, BolA protein family [Methyloglobulus morosus KoM1]|uniref:Transcriptional regulator, BolA protein family n=1 Tax=Methyloglobulus morosus KoM1 TaxID=1116472 RepID=V5E1S7_9GAMM|nr:BolA family protein [Methyloglobulus morosus]ESS73511.1 transcriptional regulator, BolA protein family [Methyloglobulus morosus KoM1]